MIKKILLITGLLVIIGGLVFGAVNRSLAKNEAELTGVEGYGRGNVEDRLPVGEEASVSAQGQGNGGNGGRRGQTGAESTYEHAELVPATGAELSVAESEALLYMREEEKLAHDVYAALYEQWGLPIFLNISQSEQSHTDSIKVLLERYNLADPASSQAGVFTNPELQALYNELVARGERSISEALKTGAAIEEIDILDLENDLAVVVQPDIQQIFQNLLQGSNNHLRAFVSNLENQTGEIYQPQYLSIEQYQSILSELSGNGAGRSEGGRGGQMGRRGGQL